MRRVWSAGSRKGDVLEAALDLGPFVAQGLAKALGVLLEGLVEQDHEVERRPLMADGVLGQGLQEVDVVGAVAGLVLQELAQFIDDQQQTVALGLGDGGLQLTDHGLDVAREEATALHQVFEDAQDGRTAAPIAPELIGPVQQGGGEPFGEWLGAAGEQDATMAGAAGTQG